MKKGKHPTFDIQHSMPKDAEEAVWEFHEGEGARRRWARLIKRKAWVKNETVLLFMLGESEELIRIFHSSIQTAKRNAQAETRKSSSPARASSGEAVQCWALNVEC